RFTGAHGIAALLHGGADAPAPAVDDVGWREPHGDAPYTTHPRTRRTQTEQKADDEPHESLDHDADLRRFDGGNGRGDSPSRSRCAARDTPVPKAMAFT